MGNESTFEGLFFEIIFKKMLESRLYAGLDENHPIIFTSMIRIPHHCLDDLFFHSDYHGHSLSKKNWKRKMK